MINLETALKALDGRNEFAVTRYEGIVSINYLVALPDSFEGVRVNFRGVTFNETTGELLSLPFHKFYNVDQNEHTRWEKLNHLNARIYEKVDGSMIHFFLFNDVLLASTRMSARTEQAKAALALVTPDMEAKIREEIKQGFTPLFEYVSPTNQVVVQHSQSRLVYLCSRSHKDGTYRYNFYQDAAKFYEFPFSDVRNRLDMEEFEGYVCHLENGMVVKIKSKWYMDRHRTVDFMMRPAYFLYEAVFDGIMDDLIANATTNRVEALNKIYTEAQTDLLNERIRLEALAAEIRGKFVTEGRELRKDFAIYVKRNHASDMSALMMAFEGRDPSKVIQQRLMDTYRVKYANRL